MSINTLRALLTREELRRELEFTEPQYNQLKEDLKEIEKQFKVSRVDERRSFQLIQTDPDFEEAKRLADRLQKLSNDRAQKAAEAASSVMMPFQVERLKQLQLRQVSDSEMGLIGFLLWKPISDELELTTRRKKELEAISNDIQLEFERELILLREKYRKRLAAELDESRRNAIGEMLGGPVKEIRVPAIKF